MRRRGQPGGGAWFFTCTSTASVWPGVAVKGPFRVATIRSGPATWIGLGPARPLLASSTSSTTAPRSANAPTKYVPGATSVGSVRRVVNDADAPAASPAVTCCVTSSRSSPGTIVPSFERRRPTAKPGAATAPRLRTTTATSSGWPATPLPGSVTLSITRSAWVTARRT